MAEQVLPSVGANLLAGYQGAQQIQSNKQANELRTMQMQQAKQAQERDTQFRNQLGTYLQGGTNALAVMYQADPERTMQVQQFQIQQNQLKQAQDIAQAKESYGQAQGVINSKAPADYFRILMPDKAAMFAKQLGKSVDELTDEEAVGIAERVAAISGSKAGILPEYSAPEAGQVGGKDVFFQSDKNSGSTRVLPGVSPRPQKPLVTVNTGDKANLKGEEKLAELEATAFSAVVQRGQDAQDKAASLRALRENPAITGPTQDLKAAANAFFSDLGVPISPERIGQISNLGQYKAMQNQLVLTEQLKQKGPQTESDAKRIAESFGNTKNIQEANKLILNYQLALADREELLAEKAEEFRQRTGKIDGWRKELRDYVRSTPLAAPNPKTGRLVFWNEFVEGMREDNPGMSDDEIMGVWRQKYAGR